MPNPDHGVMPGPEGLQIAWTRDEVTPDAAKLFRDQADGKSFKVTTLKGLEDGSAFITSYLVPGPALDYLLCEVADSLGQIDEVPSVEVVDEGDEYELQE